MPAKPLPSLRFSELPSDLSFDLIPIKFPSACLGSVPFFCECLDITNPPVQALPGKGRELNLSHIEPTAVLWRVVELDAFQNATCLFWGKRFIQSGRLMSAEVVLNE